MLRDLPITVSVEILPDEEVGEADSFVLEVTSASLTDFSTGEALDVIVSMGSVTVVINDDDGRSELSM